MSQEATIDLESGPAAIPSELDAEGDSVYGQGVAYTLGWLDARAAELGIRPLGAFCLSIEEVAWDEEDDDAEGEAEMAAPWFEARDGLATVERLIARLEGEPGAAVRDGPWVVTRDDLLWDLRVYQAILEAAAASSERFRIVVG